jgi:Sulfate permease and related transporters (MFS superfamily)
MIKSVRHSWFSNIRGDVLAGLVVALALIPEAIAFSIIAGVDPKVGLYASFCIAVVIAFVGGRSGMIYLFPYLTKKIPSPLVTIVVLTAVAMVSALDIRTVGDMGELPDTLPMFLWPDVPLSFETLAIIFPYAVSLVMVGLLESLMTATIVDDLTDTSSDNNRECKGQGWPTSPPA